MKILLVAGNANDIFITAMTKWLKATMPDTTVDIFSFYLNDLQCKNTYYDNMGYVKNDAFIFKIPKFGKEFFHFYASRELKKFLKNKHYDVIHCHWIVPPLVLTRNIHKHCNKLFITFWGREYALFKIFYSHKFYKKQLDRFITEVDYFINSKTYKAKIFSIYPELENKFFEGYLGSTPLEELYNLVKTESKTYSKKKLSIETTKTTVLIGYSGKTLHRHIPIIKELAKREELKEKIHLLAPMTRGASSDYCDKVDAALKDSGFTYTLLRDRFLSDEEVARIRNATDITLQLSTTDAFSRSIIECLCAKSILIYGDWLNYKEDLEDEKLLAHPVASIEEGVDYMTTILNKLDEFAEETEQNHNNGKIRNLWKYCIKNWVDAYINTK